MAHYAKVENNIVTQVIVAEAEFFDTFVDSSPGKWIQTSYNGNIRKNYAMVGGTYDKAGDAFYEPQPYASWTLNRTTFLWEAPTAKPEDGLVYMWNEEGGVWEQVSEVE